jgi:hypothetical protein
MDAKARLDAHHVADLDVVAAGVDVNLVAEPRQRTRELAHVDVHAATVARARLGQGRGVIREYGETSHEGSLMGALGTQRGEMRGERADGTTM